MRLAVVGGNGFIGREFIEYALAEEHDCCVIGSEYDVFSDEGRKTVKELLVQSDALVFLAARKDYNGFSKEDYRYNVDLAMTYLDICREIDMDNIVVTSSRCAYSSDVLPWKEDDMQAPLSLYGASKQAVDSLVLLYNRKYEMHIKSLRLAQVLGMGERKGFLMNTLIDNARQGIRQTVYGTGAGRKQYIYVKDVSDVILRCVTEKKYEAGIFNIAMRDNISVLETAELVNLIFNNKAGIELLKDCKEDRKEYLMDVSKASKYLEWEAHYDMEAALRCIANEDL